MKRFLFLLLSLTIICFIIFYLINDRFDINKIIKDIESDIGVNIKLEDKGKWKYYPKLRYQNNLSLKNKNNDLIIKNSSIDISRNYKITSPFLINFQSPSILYKGINFRNSIIVSKYDKEYLHINKFYADVIDGDINLSAKFYLHEKKNILIRGSYNNISLNRILKQLNISDWERVKVKLSSSNVILNTTNGSFRKIIENLNGYIDINGSAFFFSTEEERFGATFLTLLAEKFTNLSKISKSLTYILETFADTPANILGKLVIKNGVLKTKNLLISNNEEKALLSANLDLKTNFINGKIDLYNGNKVFLTVELKGNVENPKILIDGEALTEQNNSQPQDIKEIFEKGIKSLIDKFINQDD